MIENLENGSIELYDLASDLGEEEDLSEVWPLVSQELKQKLDTWRAEVKAQYPSPNEAYDPMYERSKTKKRN